MPRLPWLLLVAACSGAPGVPRPPAPAVTASADARASEPTDAEASEPGDVPARPTTISIRDVDLSSGGDARIRVRRLDGTLVPTGKDTVVALDDAKTYRIRVDEAEVAIDARSLAAMMSRQGPEDEGAPLEDARIEPLDGRLRVTGKLRRPKGVGFELLADVRLTDAGMLRLDPISLRAAGIEAKGLLKALDLHLEDLVPAGNDRGLAVDGDHVLLDPLSKLPPPAVIGKVTGARVTPEGIVLTLGPDGAGREAPDTDVDGATAQPGGNYVGFRHGRVRSGHMTWDDVNLEVVDLDAHDPLELDLRHFRRQLLAGYSKPQADQGVKLYVPDADDVGGKD